MKNSAIALCYIGVIFLFFSCKQEQNESEVRSFEWQKRISSQPLTDSLMNTGITYLSLYSQIYSLSEHKKHNLTATVSMRNTSLKDTLFISKADHYSTEGKMVSSYINRTVYLKPMETIEIVINEKEDLGGTGGNFIFEWSIPSTSPEPLFEGVMISTTSQQGLSFTTQGQKIQ